MSKTITAEYFGQIDFANIKLDEVALSAYRDSNGNDTTLVAVKLGYFDVAFSLSLFRYYSVYLSTIPEYPQKLVVAYDVYFNDLITFFVLSTLNRSFAQFYQTKSFLEILFTKQEIAACALFPVRLFSFRNLTTMFAKQQVKAGEPTAYCLIEQIAQENARDLTVVTKFVENAYKMKDYIGEEVKTNTESLVCAYYYYQLKNQLKHWKAATYQVIPCFQVFQEMLNAALEVIAQARKLRVKVEDKQVLELADELADKQRDVEEFCVAIRSYYENERLQALQIFEAADSETQD